MKFLEFDSWRTSTKVLFFMLMASLLIIPFLDHYPGFCVLTIISICVLLVAPNFMRDPLFQVGIYVHEICHGIGGIATGSQFNSFQVETEGKGWASNSGGNRTIIVSAGYVGTTLIGCLMLLSSPLLTIGTTRLIFYVLSGFCLLSLLKAVGHRTRIVAVLLSIMFFASAAFTGTLVAFMILNFFGVVLIWQGITWILILKSMILFSNQEGTDAHVMAHLHGGTPMLWAKVFLGISFGFVATVVVILML